MTPVLQLKNIRKSFGGVTAIENFSPDLHAGEVVALVGDNGAGKSTLIRIIPGVHPPTSGDILPDGAPASFADASVARNRGIGVVCQDLALAGRQTVCMNLFLGREPVKVRLRLPARRRMIAETDAMVQELDVRIPSASATIRDLSGGQRRGVAWQGVAGLGECARHAPGAQARAA